MHDIQSHALNNREQPPHAWKEQASQSKKINVKSTHNAWLKVILHQSSP